MRFPVADTERSRRLIPFVVSTGLAVAAVALTGALEAPLNGIFYFLPMASVMLAALYGGLLPALLALCVSSLGYVYLYAHPRGSLRMERKEDALRLAGYALTSLLSAAIAARVRSAQLAQREAREKTEQLAASEQRTRQLYQRIQAVTAACSAASTVTGIAHAVIDHGLRHLGALAVNVSTFADPANLRIIVSEGVPQQELDRFPLLPLDAQLPASECARTRQPVFVASIEECAARYPALAPTCERAGFGGMAALPLIAGAEVVGALGLAFRGPRTLDEEERAYAAAVATQAAQALSRARSYEAEQQAHREAVRIGNLQQELLAVVGHDLRTPLNAVTLTAAVLLQRGDLSEEQAAAVSRIARSGRRMSSLIRDLLDFTRIRQGQGFPMQFQRVDAGAVARAAVAEMEDSGARGRIDLEVAGDVVARGDPDRIQQLFSNLLGNAVQHGDGSPIRFDVRGEAEAVICSVRNGGPPIDAQVLAHLFEPFRRGSGAAHNGSVGLGLFIVKEIAQAHGAKVEVASAEGATTFTLRLPRSPAEAAPGEREAMATTKGT